MDNDLFKPLLIIGFRSKKNNSFFFIRRTLKRSYSSNDYRIKNLKLKCVSTIYSQQTSASTTGNRSRSTKNSRLKATAKKLASAAAKKVFQFFKTTRKLENDKTEVNNQRFLIKQSNPAYSYIINSYTQTLKAFFAHFSEKKRYFKINNLPSKNYLIDKLFSKNIKNSYLFLSKTIQKKKKRRTRSRVRIKLFINRVFNNLLKKKRIYFFICLSKFQNLHNNKILKKFNILKYDYFNILNNNQKLLITSNNLKIIDQKFKLLKELHFSRELKFRTLGLQNLLSSQTYKQERFESLFWETFLKIVSEDYFLPFKDVQTDLFKKKYKRWFQAKRFISGKNHKKLKQPLNIKLIFSYRLTHNGLRQKKVRRL